MAKKIMFSDKYGLTQAVLEGRKTMTRRIIKLPDGTEGIYDWTLSDHPAPLVSIRTKDGKLHNRFPVYQVGEEVAIAQSYKSIHEEMMNGDYGDSRYDAFRSAMVAGTQGWHNKMFVRADLMPHAIRITDIMVERLQDITVMESLREGIRSYDYADKTVYYYPCKNQPIEKRLEWCFETARDAFHFLINKICGEGTWGRNPWVFVYSFELVR